MPGKECPSCGAPLAVPRGSTNVKCSYCGTVVDVEWTRAAPPPEAARPGTVYMTPGLSKLVWFYIVVGTLLPVSIPIVLAVAPLIQRVAASHTVTFPAVCGMNEELDIVGKTFSGDGTLVTAGMNCTLHVKDSHLSGTVAVLANMNAHVTIENSTLEGSTSAIRLDTDAEVHLTGHSAVRSSGIGIEGGVGAKIYVEDTHVEAPRGVVLDVDAEFHGTRSEVVASDVAIGVENAGHVKLADKSRVSGTSVGVQGSNNVELSAEDSLIEGGEVGADMGLNARVRLINGAKLRGGRTALEAGENLDLVVKDSTVVATSTAICGKYNARLEVRNSNLSAAVALHFERRPDMVIEATNLVGSERFDDRGCGEPTDGAASSALPNAGSPGRRVAMPVARPSAVPPTGDAFDDDAAAIALDAAVRAARAECRSSSGHAEALTIRSAFASSGENSGARVDGPLGGSSEAICIERIFRSVRIPPFDPNTRAPGRARTVNLD